MFKLWCERGTSLMALLPQVSYSLEEGIGTIIRKVVG